MDWRLVDERLIRRGELLLNLDFLEDFELSLLNDGKIGRPFKITMSILFSWPLSASLCPIGGLRDLLGL